MKFLKNDLISGSDQFHDTLFERYHYQGRTSGSSHRLIGIHTHEVETCIRQPVIENPQNFEPIDRVVEEQQKVEQPIEHPVEQQVPREEKTLRISTIVKKIQLFLVIMSCTYKNRNTILEPNIIRKPFHMP